MYFGTKSYLKRTRNHTAKYARNQTLFRRETRGKNIQWFLYFKNIFFYIFKSF